MRRARALPARTESPCASTTEYLLVAGVFSRNREKSLAAARQLGIPEDRVYADYEAMADAESKREDGVDAVSHCYADGQPPQDR